MKTLLENSLLKELFLINDNKLSNNIKALTRVGVIVKNLPLKYKIKLAGTFSQNLTHGGMLYLEVLMRGTSRTLLRLSSNINNRLKKIETIRRYHKRNTILTNEKLYYIFNILEEASLDYLCINGLTRHLKDMERYFHVRKRRLLMTHEIIKITGLSEGRKLGEVINALIRAQFCRKIGTKREALEFLKKI
jgi:hypothetical protein